MAHASDDSNAPNTGACPHCAQAAQAQSAQPPAPSATSAAQCLSLSTRVCDQLAELAIALNGYLALERFVTPQYADETQDSLTPSRIELGALLRALNAQVQRHMDALEVGTAVLKAQMGEGGVAQAL